MKRSRGSIRGLQQEFITSPCPQRDDMMERIVRTMTEQCVHLQRFESQTTLCAWLPVDFYNSQRAPPATEDDRPGCGVLRYIHHMT